MTLSKDGLHDEIHRTALLFEPITRTVIVHAERDVDDAVLGSLYWRRADDTSYRPVWRAPDGDVRGDTLLNIRTPILAAQRPLLFFNVWESDNQKHELRSAQGDATLPPRRGWDWKCALAVDLRTVEGSPALLVDSLTSDEAGWRSAWISDLLAVSDNEEELLVVRADLIHTRVHYRIGWQQVRGPSFRAESTLRNVTY